MDTGTRLKSNFILYLTSTDYNQNQYLSIFNTAWNMFIENPIFGIGPNNFRYACSEEIFIFQNGVVPLIHIVSLFKF